MLKEDSKVVWTALEIDVPALARTKDSVKIVSQLSDSLVPVRSESDCIARIARFGVIATIERRIVSSFSL
jgi:hypothetical protein